MNEPIRSLKDQVASKPSLCRYGVVLGLKDGSEILRPERYDEWDDASAFGEAEVKEGRARGFWIRKYMKD